MLSSLCLIFFCISWFFNLSASARVVAELPFVWFMYLPTVDNSFSIMICWSIHDVMKIQVFFCLVLCIGHWYGCPNREVSPFSCITRLRGVTTVVRSRFSYLLIRYFVDVLTCRIYHLVACFIGVPGLNGPSESWFFSFPEVSVVCCCHLATEMSIELPL